MIVLCRAVQPYRHLVRLTMVKHTHQKKQKKNELLFMIIIDQLPVPSGGDNDGDLEYLSPWNNNKDDEELRSRRQSTASAAAAALAPAE
jgi:hypothetical protein